MDPMEIRAIRNNLLGLYRRAWSGARIVLCNEFRPSGYFEYGMHPAPGGVIISKWDPHFSRKARGASYECEMFFNNKISIGDAENPINILPHPKGPVIVCGDDYILFNTADVVYSGEFKMWKYHPQGFLILKDQKLLLNGSNLLYENKGEMNGFAVHPEGVVVWEGNAFFLHRKNGRREHICTKKKWKSQRWAATPKGLVFQNSAGGIYELVHGKTQSLNSLRWSFGVHESGQVYQYGPDPWRPKKLFLNGNLIPLGCCGFVADCPFGLIVHEGASNNIVLHVFK